MLQRDADPGAVAGHRSGLPGAGADGRHAGGSWLSRLGREDRAALGIWGAAHLAFLVLAWAAAWAFRSSTAHAPLTGVFEHWDATLMREVAQYGYFGPHAVPNNDAFFPGYPVALRLAHLLLRNWVLAELAVPAVAGCFAVVALARLAHERRAVLYLLTAPAVIFLMVGYTEALFLAFAVPAWLAATRGSWRRAAVLAGVAGLVDPTALFLIPALVVMALTGQHEQAHEGSVPDDPKLSHASRLAGARLVNGATAAAALLGPAVYEIYLRLNTGTWLAWPDAERAGWDRHLVSPAQSVRTTWWAAFRHSFPASTAFEFQLELGTMAALVLVAVAFGCWRRWPEAVFAGLAVVALGSATWYM
ncbi:MAG: hypothetical protein WAL16_22090, partial [Streptosporangiaceae bacterium]